jgi:hypothetical protein
MNWTLVVAPLSIILCTFLLIFNFVLVHSNDYCCFLVQKRKALTIALGTTLFIFIVTTVSGILTRDLLPGLRVDVICCYFLIF